MSPVIRYWKRVTFEEMRTCLGSCAAEEERACEVETEVIAAVRPHVNCGAFPHIERRQSLDPDVLPALVSYYLGSFVRAERQTWFRHDPVLEARLECILDAAGRHQKPFYREMDRFFAWLHDTEKRFPADFAAWRAALSAVRVGIAHRVFHEAIGGRERYKARMRLGLGAVARCRGAVEGYLHASGEGEDGFKELFGLLQRAVP